MSHDSGDPNADELLRLFVDQVCENALILLDAEGRITGWFPGAQRTFGYSAVEVLGQHVSILFTPENIEAGMVEYEQEVAKTDAEAEDDRWMLRKDGGRFWATGVLTPIRDGSGKLVGFGKLLRDCTDMRAKFDALLHQNESLKAANERKNTFISTLSHELRNPLGTLSMSASLLSVAGNDEKLMEDTAGIIEREVAAMRRMVDDLIDVTRMSAGKVFWKSVPGPAAVVEAAVESCRPSIDSRTQHLHVILPIAPLMVDVDAARMRQVFVNLIQNAVKFTKNGGTIWVKAGIEAAEAVVKVEDNGIGISPEMLPHIFDMFTQAEFLGDRESAGLA